MQIKEDIKSNEELLSDYKACSREIQLEKTQAQINPKLVNPKNYHDNLQKLNKLKEELQRRGVPLTAEPKIPRFLNSRSFSASAFRPVSKKESVGDSVVNESVVENTADAKNLK